MVCHVSLQAHIILLVYWHFVSWLASGYSLYFSGTPKNGNHWKPQSSSCFKRPLCSSFLLLIMYMGLNSVLKYTKRVVVLKYSLIVRRYTCACTSKSSKVLQIYLSTIKCTWRQPCWKRTFSKTFTKVDRNKMLYLFSRVNDQNVLAFLQSHVCHVI